MYRISFGDQCSRPSCWGLKVVNFFNPARCASIRSTTALFVIYAIYLHHLSHGMSFVVIIEVEVDIAS